MSGPSITVSSLPAVASVAAPFVPEWSKPVFHLYVIEVADRDELQRQLGAAGIGTGIHYPIPLHLQKAYEGLRLGRNSFPVTEKAAPRLLSLPMFPNLTLRRAADRGRAASPLRRFLWSCAGR